MRYGALKCIAAILFAAYAAWMLWLLFGQRIPPSGDYWENVSLNCSFVPFRTIGEFLRYFSDPTAGAIQIAVIQLFGNIIMFMPFGFLLPFLLKCLRTLNRLLTVAVPVIVAIELLQLFTLLGSFDIDDLLLNTVGVILGYIPFCAVSKRWYEA